jgi:hypothetical protein
VADLGVSGPDDPLLHAGVDDVRAALILAVLVYLIGGGTLVAPEVKAIADLYCLYAPT